MRKAYLYCVAVLVALASAAVPTAQAAVPTGVETVFTGVATDFGTIVAYGWTLFLVITGGLILFGVVKKVVHKAAS